MLNKTDIRKLAKKILHTQQGRRSVQIMHPNRDWVIGFCIALLLILVTTAWSGTNYLEIRDQIRNGVSVEAENTVVYRASNVETALSEHQRRASVVSGFAFLAPDKEEQTEEEEVATSTDPTSSSTEAALNTASTSDSEEGS